MTDSSRVERLTALKQSVGPGWSALVEQADRLAKNYQARIVGCEEKWGMLYFSVSVNANLDDGLSEELMRQLDEISNKSITVCALCGEPGQLHWFTWDYKTLCIPHIRKWYNENLPRTTRYSP